MNTEEITTREISIFDNGYEKEVLEDNWQYSSKKIRNIIFTIGAIYLIGDLIAYFSAGLLNGSTIIYPLIIPAICVVLGFFSVTKPMFSILIVAFLFLCVIVLNVYVSGSVSLLSGWIKKAVLIYLIISGIRHAKEAEEARKKLSMFH